MNNIIIETHNLSKRFGSLQAVQDVNLKVKKGEIFGFLGSNGSGKTTTIRMLCGILEPSSGTGQVAGYDIARDPERIKEIIGYMSGKFSLYGDLTVFENLEFYSDVYGVEPEVKTQRQKEVLEMVKLTGRENSLAGNLSSGLKQRLAFACSIVHNPPLLFLDEPTAGIDPASRRHLWDLFTEIASSGTTIFVTTHYMDEAERCDHVAFIYTGRIIATGSPEELKTTTLKKDMVEIEAVPLVHTFNVLKRHPHLSQTTFHGSVIHALAEKKENLLEEIKQTLEKENLSVLRTQYIKPSLEDIYISLLGEA